MAIEGLMRTTGWAWLTTANQGFPPPREELVLEYTPGRVAVAAGDVLRVAPDYARHEGHGGVVYTVRVTRVYPTATRPEVRLGGLVIAESRPYDQQYAACEVLGVETDEAFRRYGYRTWID